MKLNIPFGCTVTIHEIDKNYTGEITLKPRNCTPRTYYFLCLNPYGGSNAEFSKYMDKDMENVLGEAVGDQKQGYNPRTGKNITIYDFSNLGNNPGKIGVAFVISQIVSEAIYHAENEWRNKTIITNVRSLPTSKFTHHWEQEFRNETERYAHGFLSEFK